MNQSFLILTLLFSSLSDSEEVFSEGILSIITYCRVIAQKVTPEGI